LAQIASLTNLKHLDVSHNRNITDEGLKHLKGLASLETLVIIGLLPNVTDEGVAALVESKRDLVVIREEQYEEDEADDSRRPPRRRR
jgi:hypothetical protein